MKRRIGTREFQTAYRDAIEAIPASDLSLRLPTSADRLSAHGYLAACEPLYVEALEMLSEGAEAGWPARVLDGGGSFGAFGAALSSLGVVAVESPPDDGLVDLVIGLALHTHTASAETIATSAWRLLSPGGRLVLAVPSSLYWRRVAQIARRRPAPIDDGSVALGAPSFSGRRLRGLLGRRGLHPDRIRGCDYSPVALGGPLRQTLGGVATRAAPPLREAWLAVASRRQGA